MNLTISEIEEEISDYEDRLHLAKMDLANLPTGRLPFGEHKKREKQRQEYKSDIKHFKTLISYANEGVELRLKEAS